MSLTMSQTLVDFVVLALFPSLIQAPSAAFASSLQSTRRGLFLVLEFKDIQKAFGKMNSAMRSGINQNSCFGDNTSASQLD